MMKVMKRFLAAFLAAMIVVASVPAMETEAAGKAITARFLDWGRKTITLYGEQKTIYDASECYIGVNKCNATKFYYEVYNLKDNRQLARGYRAQAADPNNRYPAYQVFKVPGTRKTSVCKVRVRAQIGGNWSAYSGWILLVPPHTLEYVRHNTWTYNGSINISWNKFTGVKDYLVYFSNDGVHWTCIKRTVGDKCTVTSFKGSKLKKNSLYYYRIIGRSYFNGTYVLEKGDPNVNTVEIFYADLD